MSPFWRKAKLAVRLIIIFIPILFLTCITYNTCFHQVKNIMNTFSKLYENNVIQVRVNEEKWAEKKDIAYVSAFYYFPEARNQRHPAKYYVKRFAKLLTVISDDVDFYFYTNELGLQLLNLQTDIRNLYINLTYKSPYDVCGLRKFREQYIEIANKYNGEIIINENLGAIWNAKICLLDDVSHFANNYKYIFWIDAGILKRSNFTGLTIPYQKRIDKIFTNHSNQLLLELNEVYNLNNRNYEPIEQLDPNFANIVLGGFFGGTSATIRKSKDMFFKLHDLYLSQGKNVIREENIFNAMFMHYPNDYMGLDVQAKKYKCLRWDGGISFVSDQNRCLLKNQLFFADVRNGKFEFKSEDLGEWL
ncbi:hypothetical protein GPJ56_009234 [Histomonas meleagridis]|uniref:uncharacterized protein n=1 Tax=Histomonas meleagridis TaxID=135588 RepID=UPI003559DC43|nr:hypothetical protein GPJ56_009234 [Histomonas meleagridis]KAH0801605.1 hypothetical protein GO595_005604 [Histomonas meleagridis]